MGELDTGVNSLDTILPAKLYPEDELKIREKSRYLKRIPFTHGRYCYCSASEFHHLQFMTILNHFHTYFTLLNYILILEVVIACV